MNVTIRDLRNLGVLSFGVLVGLAAQAKSSVSSAIPMTSVDSYRVESQYGPEDALLNPAFPRDSKWEFTGGYVYSPFSSLVRYQGFMGSLAIHINRRHAIEPIYFVQNSSAMTDFLKTELRDKVSATLQGSNTIEMPKQTFAASYLFSPYYAKMHLTERTVAHFDVVLGAGFGILKDVPVALDGSEGARINRPSGVFTAGLRFLLPPRYAVRFEVRDFVHGERNFNQTFTANTLHISLSTSIFFGAFPE